MLLPEDIEGQTIDIRCFCKVGTRHKSRSKGVSIFYNFVGNGNLRSEELSGENPEYDKFRKLRIKLGIPIIMKPSFKLLLGYAYHAEQYEFDYFGDSYVELFQGINNLNFKSNAFAIYMTKPLDQKRYLAFRFKMSFNGAYKGWAKFDKRYMVYNAILAYGYKFSEDVELGGGLVIAKNFRNSKPAVLPFLFYNHTFNKHWGIETKIPTSIFGRYNLNPKTIFLAGMDYNSDSYSFDAILDGQTRRLSMNHSELLFLISTERQIIPWLWANVQVGYQKSFSNRFEYQNSALTDDLLLSVQPANGLYLKFGLFLSPPDKWMKQK